MAKYTTRIEGDKSAYPVLLGNGNLVESGDLDNGRCGGGDEWGWRRVGLAVWLRHTHTHIIDAVFVHMCVCAAVYTSIHAVSHASTCHIDLYTHLYTLFMQLLRHAHSVALAAVAQTHQQPCVSLSPVPRPPHTLSSLQRHSQYVPPGPPLQALCCVGRPLAQTLLPVCTGCWCAGGQGGHVCDEQRSQRDPAHLHHQEKHQQGGLCVGELDQVHEVCVRFVVCVLLCVCFLEREGFWGVVDDNVWMCSGCWWFLSSGFCLVAFV